MFPAGSRKLYTSPTTEIKSFTYSDPISADWSGVEGPIAKQHIAFREKPKPYSVKEPNLKIKEKPTTQKTFDVKSWFEGLSEQEQNQRVKFWNAEKYGSAASLKSNKKDFSSFLKWLKKNKK